MTTRRHFLIALSAATWFSQRASAQPAVHRIGWISLDRADGSIYFEPFRAGLRDLGYVDGKNLMIDARWGEGSRERISQLAAELVQSKPQVIVTAGGSALHPVRKAGATMPVVFGYSGDPVEAGLVESLARPGGNLTGLTYLALELVGKRIELLKEALPALKRVAVLANPEHPGDQSELRASQLAAARLGLALQYVPVRTAPGLEEALASILKSGSEAVVVFPDALTVRNRETIAQFGLKHRIPVISGWSQFAASGCLMSYGPNLVSSYRRMAYFVDRILKGAKPAELPVELPTGVELAVNLTTAKALRITLPPSILVRADKVIE